MWVVYLLGVVVVMYFVSQIIESRDQNNRHKKFMHDMALVQQRAESRIPGAQYDGSLLRDAAAAEKMYTEAGEFTNREVLGVARSLYGTGLRA